MADSATPPKPGLPWHWLIFLPVVVSVIAGLSTLAIAIRYGDRPLPETVLRTGPVQYGDNAGVQRARELGVSGSARFDRIGHGIVLTLSGRELPAQLQLRLWHPTETDLDQMVLLTRGDDGSYRGVWPQRADGLLPLLSSPEVGWELPGARDSAADTLIFQP